jgi:hypothetical protein
MEVTLSEAARQIGVSKQMMHYYLPSLTHRRSGGVILLDPEVARKELHELGYRSRNERRQRRTNLSSGTRRSESKVV